MIAVRLRYLPMDSATAIELGGSGWLLEHYLAAHLFEAMAGEPHPALPKHQAVVSPERAKKIQSAKQRAEERRRAIAAGEIT